MMETKIYTIAGHETKLQVFEVDYKMVKVVSREMAVELNRIFYTK